MAEEKTTNKSKGAPNVLWVGTLVWVLFWMSIYVLKVINDFEYLSDISKAGAFFAGIFSPVAFLWLIYGYFMQKEELELQRKVLKVQNKEFKKFVNSSEYNNRIQRAEYQPEFDIFGLNKAMLEIRHPLEFKMPWMEKDQLNSISAGAIKFDFLNSKRPLDMLFLFEKNSYDGPKYILKTKNGFTFVYKKADVVVNSKNFIRLYFYYKDQTSHYVLIEYRISSPQGPFPYIQFENIHFLPLSNIAGLEYKIISETDSSSNKLINRYIDATKEFILS